MRDYINIGCPPYDEDCVQVGTEDYEGRACAECARFIALIRAELGPEPEGASLSVKSFTYDFGTYHEVVCWYDTEYEQSLAYAYRCERDAPSRYERAQALAPHPEAWYRGRSKHMTITRRTYKAGLERLEDAVIRAWASSQNSDSDEAWEGYKEAWRRYRRLLDRFHRELGSYRYP